MLKPNMYSAAKKSSLSFAIVSVVIPFLKDGRRTAPGNGTTFSAGGAFAAARMRCPSSSLLYTLCEVRISCEVRIRSQEPLRGTAGHSGAKPGSCWVFCRYRAPNPQLGRVVCSRECGPAGGLEQCPCFCFAPSIWYSRHPVSKSFRHPLDLLISASVQPVL